MAAPAMPESLQGFQAAYNTNLGIIKHGTEIGLERVLKFTVTVCQPIASGWSGRGPARGRDGGLGGP